MIRNTPSSDGSEMSIDEIVNDEREHFFSYLHIKPVHSTNHTFWVEYKSKLRESGLFCAWPSFQAYGSFIVDTVCPSWTSQRSLTGQPEELPSEMLQLLLLSLKLPALFYCCSSKQTVSSSAQTAVWLHNILACFFLYIVKLLFLHTAWSKKKKDIQILDFLWILTNI